MYTDYYKFSGLPFQLTPDARFFFASSGHSKAMAHLTYGLGQGEGFIIITGDIGAGKTTVVENLLQQLDSRKYVAATITNTQLGADDMLRMVASAFGVAQEGVDKATLLRRLEAFLARIHQQGQRALLLVDECQNLSVPALEELRMLSNLQIGGRAPLQSFLLGQPQFRDTLARGELDQLRQRVIASYHLGPLNEAETRHYIEHRLRTVGWHADPQLRPSRADRGGCRRGGARSRTGILARAAAKARRGRCDADRRGRGLRDPRQADRRARNLGQRAGPDHSQTSQDGGCLSRQ